MSIPFVNVFGVLVAAAILISGYVARREVARHETLGTLPPGTARAFTDVVLTSLIAAIAGARLFHVLEYPRLFIEQPMSAIFSRSGFSIYGGLVFGILTAVLLLRRRRIPVLPVLDAAAPALMLGYAIGRIGCQLAGDGDWGIAADLALKPEWLPAWFWAQTYDGNVVGITIPPPGVYPTPLYETAMALLLFAVLWRFRAHGQRAGFLFSLYALLAGFERLLIEKIRVNAQYQLFDFTFTQAEAISVVLILAGCAGILGTLRSRVLLPRLLIATAVLLTLTACVRL